MLTVRCRLFDNRFWGMSSNPYRSCDLHEALRCNVNLTLGTVHGVTLNCLATSTANPLRFRSLDRWDVSSADCALGALRKARRNPASTAKSSVAGSHTLFRLRNFNSRCDSDIQLWCIPQGAGCSKISSWRIHPSMKAGKVEVAQKIVGKKVRREKRWTSAGVTPTRELVCSSR